MSSRFELPALAEAFLKAGIYLRNWRPRTVSTYRQGLTCLYQTIPDPIPTKADLDGWVIAMRECGLTAGGCNMYIRTVNSFLSWMREEGQLDTHLRVKLLRAPQRQLTLLSSADVRALLSDPECAKVRSNACGALRQNSACSQHVHASTVPIRCCFLVWCERDPTVLNTVRVYQYLQTASLYCETADCLFDASPF